MRESERGKGTSGSSMVFQNEGEYFPARKQTTFHILDQTTTSFYFTNFPDDSKTTALWSMFARFGIVGEVFIPNKLDKGGKRFGFVKFKEVKDPAVLETRLSNVWFGGSRLKVNLARFNRDSEVLPEVSREGGGRFGRIHLWRMGSRSNSLWTRRLAERVREGLPCLSWWFF